MNAYIKNLDGTKTPIKNLGWLLRNWQYITEMGFRYAPADSWDGELWAKIRDGREYVTKFADLSVCWNFLERPIFFSLPFTFEVLGTDPKYFVIGNDEWKRINGLEYADFKKALNL